MKVSSSRKVSEHLRVVAKDVAIASLASFHVNNGSVGILHGTLLDPWLDVFLGGQFEHFVDFFGAANGAAANLDTIADKSEGIDVRKLATIGGTDLNESALGLEQGDVALKGHLSARHSGDDQIKSAAVVLCPVFVVIGSDVSVGTELEDLVLLGCLARDTDDLISSKSLGEQNTKVTKTTDTNNTDLLSIRMYPVSANLSELTFLPGPAP